MDDHQVQLATYMPSESKLEFARSQPIPSPADALPTELLIDILLKSDIPVDNQNFHRLHDLARVCARWWKIIKDTPDFWINIYSGDVARTRIQIRRSGTMPIRVSYYSITPPENPEPDHHIRPFMEVVKPTADRWRSLIINAPEAVDIFRPLLLGPTPLLVSINLAGYMYTETTSVQLSSTSQLQSISLSHASVTVPLLPNPFASLQYLYLTGQYYNAGDRFLRILECSNNLTELHVNGVWTERPQSGDLHQRIILLPILRILRMEAMHSRAFKNVLERLSTPGLTSLEIRMLPPQLRYGILDVRPLFDRTKDYPPIPFQLLSNIQFKRFDICVEQDSFTLEWANDERALVGDQHQPKLLISLPIPNDWPWHIWRLARNLSKWHDRLPIALHLTRSVPAIPHGTNLNFLLLLPSLISLNIECDDTSVLTTMIAYLSDPQPNTNEPPVESWVCPRLARIDVRASEHHVPALLQMVKNRRPAAIQNVAEESSTRAGGPMRESATPILQDLRVYRMGSAGQEVLDENLRDFILL